MMGLTTCGQQGGTYLCEFIWPLCFCSSPWITCPGQLVQHVTQKEPPGTNVNLIQMEMPNPAEANPEGQLLG